MAEVGCVAEAEESCDVFDGEPRLAEVADSHLHAQLIDDLAKRRVFFAKLPS
jgi:hypothetical protein